MALKLVNTQRPCKECDHLVKLYDYGNLCLNGMCGFTGRIQPIHGSWYCEHFKSGEVRMHPRVRFKTRKRRKKRAKVH